MSGDSYALLRSNFLPQMACMLGPFWVPETSGRIRFVNARHELRIAATRGDPYAPDGVRVGVAWDWQILGILGATQCRSLSVTADAQTRPATPAAVRTCP
jgi:hypothetical protein